jgi:hypothetical protein
VGVVVAAPGGHRNDHEMSADAAGTVDRLRNYPLPLAPPMVLAMFRSPCSCA